MTSTAVTPDEVAIIRAMDAVYLAGMAKEQAEATERAKQKKD